MVQAHEAECSHPVLDLDHDNVVIKQLVGAVEEVAAGEEGAAVDVEHHREAATLTRRLWREYC